MSLFYESSRPPLLIFSEVKGLDKLAHFFAFGLLTAILESIAEYLQLRRYLFSVLLVLILGFSLEYYQSIGKFRQFDLIDVVADMFGAIFLLKISARLSYFSGRKFGLRLEFESRPRNRLGFEKKRLS